MRTNNNETRQNRAIVYDYKEVTVEPNHASMILGGYENFGWQPDGNFTEKQNRSEQSRTLIRMKRDRKIINKAELTRLQRNFESCMEQIASLEHSKTSAATMTALIIGVIGTAFMAGSTFAVTAPSPYITLSIVLAVPGFIGWIAPYFLYKRMVKKQEDKVESLIEDKLDEIYEICEKGSHLLN